MRRLFTMKIALLLGSIGRAALPAHAADPPPLPILAERLPSSSLRCLIKGTEGCPGEALRGKPALVVIAERRGGVPGPLVAAIEALQQEYAPWLGWGVVVIGSGAPDRGMLPDGLGRLRLEGCWVDPDGSWRSWLAGSDLPSVVLVNESGYVIRRQAGWRAGDESALRPAIERLAGAGRLRRGPARDFKLEEVGSGRLVTLADVATRDYTLLFSLRTDCSVCFDELGLLNRIRQERPGRVTLVAIDHDPQGGSGAPSSSWDDRLRADLVLRDPDLRYAARYGLEGVPALLMVDGGGRIVFARQGFRPEEMTALAGELRRTIDGEGAVDRESLQFAEFRRVRAEGQALLDGGRPGMASFFFERALELFPEFHTVQSQAAEAYQAAGKLQEAARAYGRYLASEPLPCDRENILRRIKTLAAVQ